MTTPTPALAVKRTNTRLFGLALSTIPVAGFAGLITDVVPAHRPVIDTALAVLAVCVLLSAPRPLRGRARAVVWIGFFGLAVPAIAVAAGLALAAALTTPARLWTVLLYPALVLVVHSLWLHCIEGGVDGGE